MNHLFKSKNSKFLDKPNGNISCSVISSMALPRAIIIRSKMAKNFDMTAFDRSGSQTPPEVSTSQLSFNPRLNLPRSRINIAPSNCQSPISSPI